MKIADAGNVLMILETNPEMTQELLQSLSATGYVADLKHDLGEAINCAQHFPYDVVVLDANVKGMPIEHTIQIFRYINSNAKIIIKTDSNSKDLEAKIRKEKIYYYHLDSFGIADLIMAIQSAVNQKRKFKTWESKSKKILIVDENDDFMEIHRTNLMNHGYDVEIDYDADLAYQRVKQQHPDLIMVDINTRVGSDGLHFLEKMMNDKEIYDIPVLLFVSDLQLKEYERLMNEIKSTLPTWTYLQKPVKIEDVIPRVEQLIHFNYKIQTA